MFLSFILNNRRLSMCTWRFRAKQRQIENKKSIKERTIPQGFGVFKSLITKPKTEDSIMVSRKERMTRNFRRGQRNCEYDIQS